MEKEKNNLVIFTKKIPLPFVKDETPHIFKDRFYEGKNGWKNFNKTYLKQLANEKNN